MTDKEINIETFFTFAKPKIQLSTEKTARLGTIITYWSDISLATTRLEAICIKLRHQIDNYKAPSVSYDVISGTYDPYKNTRALKIVNNLDYYEKLLSFGNGLIKEIDYAMNTMLKEEEKDFLVSEDENSADISRATFFRKKRELLDRVSLLVPYI